MCQPDFELEKNIRHTPVTMSNKSELSSYCRHCCLAERQRHGEFDNRIQRDSMESKRNGWNRIEEMSASRCEEISLKSMRAARRMRQMRGACESVFTWSYINLNEIVLIDLIFGETTEPFRLWIINCSRPCTTNYHLKIGRKNNNCGSKRNPIWIIKWISIEWMFHDSLFTQCCFD